jgi:hypothetical protein
MAVAVTVREMLESAGNGRDRDPGMLGVAGRARIL